MRVANHRAHQIGLIVTMASLLLTALAGFWTAPGGTASAQDNVRPTLDPQTEAGASRPDLCTLVPDGGRSCADDPPPNVCLRLDALAQSPVEDQAVVLLRATAFNSGGRRANGLVIRLPLIAREQRLVDVRLAGAAAWVESATADQVTLRVEQLRPGETMTATLILRHETHAADPVVFRSTWTYGSWRGSQPALSNRAVSSFSAPYGQQIAALRVKELDDPQTYLLSDDSFTSREQISLWYNRSDGTAIAIGSARANEQGVLAYVLDAKALPNGRYQLVAYGQCSQVIASAALELNPNR